MVIQHFPNQIQNNFKIQNETACPFNSWPSVTQWPNMLAQRYHTRRSVTQFVSPLSISCVFNGKAHFKIDGKHVSIDDNAYLLVNCSQTILGDIDPATRPETFSVFFQHQFVKESFATLITPNDQLLDGVDSNAIQPIYFFDKSYHHDNMLTPILYKLRNAANTGKVTPAWFEEQLYVLFERMLCVHRNIRYEIDKLPAIRLATRVEIYRRLHRAKDFIDSCFNQNITLAQMAEQAFLSPYHFLRLFKNLFRETPYQYLTRKRLQTAKDLVLRTKKSIAEICFEVGFESLGSFSWLFRKHYKVSPSKLRPSK